MPASAREINKEVLSMRQWCWDMKRRGRGSRRTGKKSHTWRSRLHGTGYPESEQPRRAPSVFTISIRPYVFGSLELRCLSPEQSDKSTAYSGTWKRRNLQSQGFQVLGSCTKTGYKWRKRLTRIVLFLLEGRGAGLGKVLF